MATTFYNQKYSASFPKKSNKREARLSSTNNAMCEFDDNYTIPDDDNTDIFACTATTAKTLTAPKAANSKGRCITVRQSGAAGTCDVVAASGDTLEAPTVDPLTTGTWATWFCTGTEWKLVKEG